MVKGCRKDSILIARSGLALPFMLLAGCYPHPHDYVLTQEFTGVLLESGTPMSGVTVTVSHTRGDSGDYCEKPEVMGVTNDTGHFRVPPQVQRQIFRSVINPPEVVSQLMSVCFRTAGKLKLGALINSPTDHQVSYSAVCEWTSPGAAFKQALVQSPHEFGICTRIDPPAEH